MSEWSVVTTGMGSKLKVYAKSTDGSWITAQDIEDALDLLYPLVEAAMTEKTDEELGKLARIALTAYWSKH